MSIELRNTVRWILQSTCALGATLALAPTVAVAQDPAASATLEEVMVSARRSGATDLQSTPVSITAVTSADIDRLVAKDLSGIASSVPGFSASRITAFNAASFAMRGIGITDIIVYQDSPVGVLVDDFVMPSVQTQLLDTFDIASVEVLRGPQGTLFGKNTTGGAVNIKTKRPDLQNAGADLRVSYGSFNERRIQAAADLPLIQDVFSIRLVGSMVKSDGYYKLGADWGPIQTFNFNPTFGPIGPINIPGVTGRSGGGTGEDAGGEDVINGRVKLLWQPSENFSAMLQLESMRDRSDAVPSYNDTPANSPYLWALLGFTRPAGDPLDNMASSNRNDLLIGMGEGQEIDVDGGYLNLEWDLGGHKLYSATGIRTQYEHLPNTYTGAAPTNAAGQPLSLFDATRDTDRITVQQEFRLASESDGPFNYVLGAFYQRNDAKYCVVQALGFVDLITNWAAGGLPAQFLNNAPQILCNRQGSDSLAGFADMTFQLTDKFQVGAGFRYTEDTKDWEGRRQVFFGQLDPSNPNLTWQGLELPLDAADFERFGAGTVNKDTAGFSNLERTWSEPSWRVTGSYQATDQLFVYGTVSEGYKAGGYNDQTGTSGLLVSALTRPVDPEFATSYELGMKFESASKRFRFNPTVFFVEYEDAQRAANIVTERLGAQFQETVFYNAAQVTSKGVELELQALVTDNFIIRAQAAYLDAKYDEFIINQPALTDPSTGGSILPLTANLTGLPVPRSPENSGAISGTYTMDAFGGSLDIVGEVYYEDENLFYISALGRQYDAYLDSKTLVNASVTYTAGDGSYFVRAFGKNLSDERYRIASQSVAGLWIHTQFGAPRTFGVELGMKFGGQR